MKKKPLTKKHSHRRTPSRAYNVGVDFDEIRRRRKELGLNQTQAAKAAGWDSQQQWAKLEGGKRSDPHVSTLLAVCRALRCEITDLLRKQ